MFGDLAKSLASKARVSEVSREINRGLNFFPPKKTNEPIHILAPLFFCERKLFG